jgi:hypothetical protein
VKLSLIFKRRILWHIYVYKADHEVNIQDIPALTPIIKIGASGLRLSSSFAHTHADPFLWVHKDKLYIFYEVKGDFSKGEIHVGAIEDDKFKYIGLALKEEHHLSYPHVFSHNGVAYMIPEASESGMVYLYEAVSFPNEWEAKRVLVHEPLVDINIIEHESSIYLIGSSATQGLKVFRSNNLFGDFHCIFTQGINDKSRSRNGGPITRIKDSFYRYFQNNENYYGERIGVSKINSLTKYSYSEEVVSNDVLGKEKPRHLRRGYHHVSTARFKNNTYITVDGMSNDSYINTLLYAFFRIKNLPRLKHGSH